MWRLVGAGVALHFAFSASADEAAEVMSTTPESTLEVLEEDVVSVVSDVAEVLEIKPVPPTTYTNWTHVRIDNITSWPTGEEMQIKRGILQRIADPFNFKDPYFSILYLIGDIYIFCALHLVVHARFAPAMEKIVELSEMNEDVAGATLLAIGTSLPEVLSGAVGVFVPGAGDTGLGTVVGSLVFNMLMITGCVVALFPKEHLRLSKSATIRDIGFQVIVILMLVWAFSDKQADITNVVMFLLLYLVYILVCAQSGTIAHACMVDSTHNMEELAGEDDDEEEEEEQTGKSDADSNTDLKHPDDAHASVERFCPPPTSPLDLVIYVLSIPLMLCELLIVLSVPDIKSERWSRCMGTALAINLLMSTVWLGTLVLFMIQWATKAGELLGISASVMGLTFCAAGTSVPDLMVSVIVAKQGKGNMAISNVFGSNVFDILIAMAVPWALSYAIYGTEELVKMEAEGFDSAIMILALVMSFYVACVCIFRFRLPRKVGYLHIALYAVFVVYVFVKNMAVFKEKEPSEYE